MKSAIFTALLSAALIFGESAVAQLGDIVCPVDDLCFAEPPTCEAGSIASAASLGCWRCCRVVCPTVAAAIPCLATRPICLETEAVSGVEGCWGCCYPLATLN